jgi:hypothetical protein
MTWWVGIFALLMTLRWIQGYEVHGLAAVRMAVWAIVILGTSVAVPSVLKQLLPDQKEVQDKSKVKL